PMNPVSAATSNLLSFGGKFRALLGALGFISPIVGNETFSQTGEETVRQFFLRHLGKEVTERLISPFVSGVYAGDVDQLAAKSAFRKIYRLTTVGGGLIPGTLLTAKERKQKALANYDPSVPQVKSGELACFKDGLESLPKAIAANLKDQLKLQWQMINLRQTENKTYIAEFNTPEGLQTIETRSIVLTTPSHITTEILKSVAPVASESLKLIPYPPVASVVLAYPENATIKLGGFGNLIPRGQGIRTLGSVWTSTLFPGKNPPGWVMITNFIGGATDLELGTLSDDQIVQCVHEDLKQILLVKDVQPKVLSVHLWKKAIPQYNLGHQNRLDQLNQDLKNLPGLYVCTNYTDGVALGDCVQRALDLSEVIKTYL
ncbi:MAG TPA: protoporphyrinogen oxidase, partial [Allocoleopsis sp.]